MPQQPNIHGEQMPMGTMNVVPLEPLNSLNPLLRAQLLRKWQEMAVGKPGPLLNYPTGSGPLGPNKLLQLLQAEAMDGSGIPRPLPKSEKEPIYMLDTNGRYVPAYNYGSTGVRG